MPLTIAHKQKFLNLAIALSPENISCDGERSRSQIAARRREITGQWAALERQAGVKVTEEEAYSFSREVDANERKERTAAVSKLPQHRLVESNNPGVWTRKGQDGRTAYYIWGPPQHGETYTVFSDVAYSMLNRKEKVSEGHKTLKEAVEAAEAFLATVTWEAIAAANPMWQPETIKRSIERMPVEHKITAPAMPVVTGYQVYMNKTMVREIKLADLKPGRAPATLNDLIAKLLTERGDQLSIRAI